MVVLAIEARNLLGDPGVKTAIVSHLSMPCSSSGVHNYQDRAEGALELQGENGKPDLPGNLVSCSKFLLHQIISCIITQQ